jgi:hypothetical protein
MTQALYAHMNNKRKMKKKIAQEAEKKKFMLKCSPSNTLFYHVAPNILLDHVTVN